MTSEDRLGSLCRFACPECHGTLWEIAEGPMLRYRCHVGHAFTAEAMLTAQADEVDRLLWTLLRNHQERAALARRMAEQERLRHRGSLARQLQARAHDYENDAELVRRLLLKRDEAAEAPATLEKQRVRASHEQKQE